ncbi:hypothetical protein BFW01_g9133 [Lasiodiplodia theobromae]|uniref:Glycoside hydrolase family 18 protein n=1 Tax=Lasiodiplodia theobromae TaxID=45133 RepID=UPI0015C34C4C|nr:Glycoside hydrolase family 18 protein [Lasiodiplodia theobromae]KAF4533948.1 Glycoside hydrolase family 18 protein [Lasiodiplodia theobromae]KAF9638236.1 hypothetical protein BFW01_g9133 [Lasiodiplodia theobromae]
MGDIAELSMPSAQQLEQLSIANLLTERILIIGRSLLGSNRALDVVTYRLPNSEQSADYVAELIEHTGPSQASTILRARNDLRTKALFMLLDRAERELNITMSQACSVAGVQVINTRRLGGHRCTGCNGPCSGGPAA